VRRGFERAEQAGRLLRERPEWTVVTPAQMGIVTFRCVPDGWTVDEVDALNRRLAPALSGEGEVFLTQTALEDRPVLRLCPINPRTTADDIETTIDRLDALRRTRVGP
jgi:glutamate/tyrosine decarboxylase-like PLP-dependent enzyme